MQVRVQQLGPGMMQQIQSMCGECQGTGERIDPKLRCKKCVGKKVNRERKILEVVVDKGKKWILMLYKWPVFSFEVLELVCCKKQPKKSS